MKKKKTKDELGPKFLDMYSSIYSMRQELDRIRKPVGTRENPARTCKDLFYGHPQFESNWYWVDPNLGMVDDAVYVFCNMTNGQTCVFPDVHTSVSWKNLRLVIFFNNSHFSDYAHNSMEKRKRKN